MRVLVYGAGSVGLGLASALAGEGVEPVLLARPAAAEELARRGILRTGILGEVHVPPGRFRVAASLAEAAGAGPFDFIAVCVKSFDSEEAAESLAGVPGAIGPGSRIVLFQNGWGNREVFLRRFPAEIVFNARVITGFRRPALHHTDVTVHGDAIRAGGLGPGQSPEEVRPLCEALTRGGIPAEPSAEIGRFIWAKILYNCALNPLGAIFGQCYGETASNPRTRRILEEAVREVYAVMRAAGHESFHPGPEEYLREFHGRMVPATAAHYPSTLQDLRAGKRTEIGAMNGAIVRLAEEHGIRAPVNATLTEMVKFLEERDANPSIP